MSVTKYNRKSVFNAKPKEDLEYYSLGELFNQNRKEHIVLAMYISNKGMYGPAPVILTNECFINLPKHLTETVREMIQDKEVIDSVNNGNVGIEIYEYFPKKEGHSKKRCYSVNWLDLA